MPHDCAVNCDHLQTVPKNRLGPLLTTLSAAKMRKVSQVVAFVLNPGK
jgi:mRNA interferase MazF